MVKFNFWNLNLSRNHLKSIYICCNSKCIYLLSNKIINITFQDGIIINELTLYNNLLNDLPNDSSIHLYNINLVKNLIATMLIKRYGPEDKYRSNLRSYPELFRNTQLKLITLRESDSEYICR